MPFTIDQQKINFGVSAGADADSANLHGSYFDDTYFGAATVEDSGTVDNLFQRRTATGGSWATADTGATYDLGQVSYSIYTCMLSADRGILTYYDNGASQDTILSIDTSGTSPSIDDTDVISTGVFKPMALCRKSATEAILCHGVLDVASHDLVARTLTIGGGGALTVGSPTVLESDGISLLSDYSSICVVPFGSNFIVAYEYGGFCKLKLFNSSFSVLDTHTCTGGGFDRRCMDVISASANGVYYVTREKSYSSVDPIGDVTIGYVPIASNSFGTQTTVALKEDINAQDSVAGVAAFSDTAALGVYTVGATETADNLRYVEVAVTGGTISVGQEKILPQQLGETFSFDDGVSVGAGIQDFLTVTPVDSTTAIVSFKSLNDGAYSWQRSLLTMVDRKFYSGSATLTERSDMPFAVQPAGGVIVKNDGEVWACNREAPAATLEPVQKATDADTFASWNTFDTGTHPQLAIKRIIEVIVA